jgi:hypothetical protein
MVALYDTVRLREATVQLRVTHRRLAPLIGEGAPVLDACDYRFDTGPHSFRAGRGHRPRPTFCGACDQPSAWASHRSGPKTS